MELQRRRILAILPSEQRLDWLGAALIRRRLSHQELVRVRVFLIEEIDLKELLMVSRRHWSLPERLTTARSFALRSERLPCPRQAATRATWRQPVKAVRVFLIAALQLLLHSRPVNAMHHAVLRRWSRSRRRAMNQDHPPALDRPRGVPPNWLAHPTMRWMLRRSQACSWPGPARHCATRCARLRLWSAQT